MMFSKGLQNRAKMRDALNEVEAALQLIDEAAVGFETVMRARKDDLAGMDRGYMARLDSLAANMNGQRNDIAGLLYRAEQLAEKGQL